MPDPKSKFTRKIANIIIMPSYQIRYIFWLSARGFCLVGINALVVYHYFKENYLSLMELSPMTEAARNQLFNEMHQFLLIMIAVSLGFMALMTLVGLVVSHRTAGPLFHFKRVFEEIRSGETKARIRLRPKDEFKEVAEAFNKMMDTLQNK